MCGKGKGGRKAGQTEGRQDGTAESFSVFRSYRARMNDLLRLSLVLVQGYLWESIQMPAEWVTGSAPL